MSNEWTNGRHRYHEGCFKVLGFQDSPCRLTIQSGNSPWKVSVVVVDTGPRTLVTKMPEYQSYGGSSGRVGARYLRIVIKTYEARDKIIGWSWGAIIGADGGSRKYIWGFAGCVGNSDWTVPVSWRKLFVPICIISRYEIRSPWIVRGMRRTHLRKCILMTLSGMTVVLSTTICTFDTDCDCGRANETTGAEERTDILDRFSCELQVLLQVRIVGFRSKRLSIVL